MTQAFEISIDDKLFFTCRSDSTVMRVMGEKRIGHKYHGCCGGGCGICKMKIVAGEYEITSRMSRAHVSWEEEAAGVVLLCCIQPRSNLKIQTI